MDTQQIDLTQEQATEQIQPEVKLPDAPAYVFRAMFRPKLLEFFNQTNKENGSYKLAEQQTKEWFLKEYGIKISAWHYRNRREPIPQD